MADCPYCGAIYDKESCKGDVGYGCPSFIEFQERETAAYLTCSQQNVMNRAVRRTFKMQDDEDISLPPHTSATEEGRDLMTIAAALSDVKPGPNSLREAADASLLRVRKRLAFTARVERLEAALRSITNHPYAGRENKAIIRAALGDATEGGKNTT